MLLRREQDGIALAAQMIPMGTDLCVAVYGGTQPHVGSVAVGLPRPSRTDPAVTKATVSTFNLTGHQDDTVANCFSSVLAAALGSPVAVVCGIHMEHITSTQLHTVQELAQALLADCLSALKAGKTG